MVVVPVAATIVRWKRTELGNTRTRMSKDADSRKDVMHIFPAVPSRREEFWRRSYPYMLHNDRTT
jgi:hypothetical protein